MKPNDFSDGNEDEEKETESLPEYFPEFSQAIFGNIWQPHEAYWCKNGIMWLTETIRVSFGIDFDSEAEFESELFDLRPYYWGNEKSETKLPNFHYKPKDIQVFWYKYLGRGMTSNQKQIPIDWPSIITSCSQFVIDTAANGEFNLDGEDFEDE
jgi:hypothetical protein